MRRSGLLFRVFTWQTGSFRCCCKTPVVAPPVHQAPLNRSSLLSGTDRVVQLVSSPFGQPVTTRTSHSPCSLRGTVFSRSLITGSLDKSSAEKPQKPVFEPEKVAVLTKITRYDYEKRLHCYWSEEELKRHLKERGSDYEGLKQMHDSHHEKVNQIIEALESRGAQVRLVERFEYTPELIDWADAVVTAGGDGTFLLGASKIKTVDKPLIGVNTDLLRSEGYLCLPRYYSQNFPEALDRLLTGKFKWHWRQRIRITMSGRHANDPGIELHDEELQNPEHRFTEHVKEHEETLAKANQTSTKPERVLPILALNEVFMGESLSARVSYYEISIDDSPREKQKSSGVTICTGTGSSSWYFNINHNHKSSIKKLLQIANDVGNLNFPEDDEVFLRKVTRMYNRHLRFDPSLLKMAFTVRDPVVNGIFQVSNPNGFADRMTVKSRMWDARLVVDGGSSFQFNDGAIATLEMFKDDALRTVQLDQVPFKLPRDSGEL